ncbi:DMT family transporter [Paenibacillus thailandensis]|uniref:DMT family transporter n=1 Tax=Paenibacillus thailandensis TaxID=393250 RepID=A0ABW5QY77_9BACL
MAWVALIFAGLFEMGGVAMMNKVNRELSWKTVGGLIACFALSFLLLSYAMNSLPMGTAYAIWTGIGASGGAIVGMLAFGESKDWKRIACIVLVLGAAAGLKAVS